MERFYREFDKKIQEVMNEHFTKPKYDTEFDVWVIHSKTLRSRFDVRTKYRKNAVWHMKKMIADKLAYNYQTQSIK